MPCYAVYTASDRRYGDFLIDHWLRSLRDHGGLADTEIRVLDYGLSTAQRYYLTHEGVRVIPCVRDGHPAVIRFRDMAADLDRHPVDQVLAADGGDIIFQADITPLFHRHPGEFRAVSEPVTGGSDAFLTEEFFDRDDLRRLRDDLAGRPQINAGLLVGPGRRFAELCRQVDRTVRRQDKFGPDQLVVNQVLHGQGYVELDAGWNFVVATARRPFTILAGTFVFADTFEPVPVVHNAGNWSLLRPIRDFGYGPGRNELKTDVLETLRLVHRSTSLIAGTRHRLKTLRRRAWEKAIGALG